MPHPLIAGNYNPCLLPTREILKKRHRVMRSEHNSVLAGNYPGTPSPTALRSPLSPKGRGKKIPNFGPVFI